jgi:hypothetical protein
MALIKFGLIERKESPCKRNYRTVMFGTIGKSKNTMIEKTVLSKNEKNRLRIVR